MRGAGLRSSESVFVICAPRARFGPERGAFIVTSRGARRPSGQSQDPAIGAGSISE